MRLSTKLALLLLSGGVGSLSFFGYWNLRLHERNSEELLIQSAERLCDLILRATRHQMMRNDREALYQTLRDIGSEPGIRRVRIFSQVGQITYSTDAAETGHVVDKSAEACFGCHSQSEPLAKLNRPDRARIFKENGGERLLAVIRPIENRAECSSAACHAHPANLKVLGVVDSQLSLHTVDEQLSRQERMITQFAAGSALLIVIATTLFVWTAVHRPLRELLDGIHRVAAGQLDQRVAVRSNDELGDVARSFNRMTEDLQAARHEVTEWARTLEERVDRKSRELEMAHRSLIHNEKLASVGKLAATVAHEINNPLFGIVTAARLGLKQTGTLPVDPETRDKMAGRLRLIERESQRCGEIVKNLLAFSRQSPAKHEPVDLRVVIERSLALVKHQMDLKGITLQADVGEAMIEGDSGRLQQVVVVLLVNAIEAMPSGGLIAVSMRAREDGIEIRVRDSGAGIAKEVLPHIFEPFFSTKEGGQQTGLGLAIAAGIVEEHGGTIGVTSEAGHGAEFTICLPAPVAAAAPGGVP